MSDIREAFEALDELVEMAVQHHGQVRTADEYRDTIKAALQSQTAPAVPVEPNNMALMLREIVDMWDGPRYALQMKPLIDRARKLLSDHSPDAGKVVPDEIESSFRKWCDRNSPPLLSVNLARGAHSAGWWDGQNATPSVPENEVKARALEWSDPQNPNEKCSYNHVTAETPFGRFLITWKGWKEYDDPTIDETPWGEFGGVGCDLEDAKNICEREYFARLRASQQEGGDA